MLADRVPNSMPVKAAARRLAIVAEAPSLQERAWHTCAKCRFEFATEWRDVHGYHTTDRCTQCFCTDIVSTPKPLVGPSGWLLNKLLAGAGIDRDACFVGNCCQVQAPGNDISRFKWDGPELTEGLAQLQNDLIHYRPDFILCLGNTPLRAFSKDRKRNIGDWRGSLFQTWIAARQVKALATYHPAALLREAGLTGVTKFDLKRVVEESRTDGLEVPRDTIVVDADKALLISWLALVRKNQQRVAIDIEGGVDYVSCVGFAASANDAVVVPFIKADGTSYWCEDDEVELWEAVAAVLSDPAVPKVLQNYLYDAFVLAWSYGILIRGLADDIMLKHFELYPEFEKSLGFQTSIYTRHPFYKFERKSDDETVQLTYCGKDCCRTFEINEHLEPLLMPGQAKHYRANIELLAPLIYMELRGMRFDHEAAQQRLAATTKRIYALQDKINREAASSRLALKAYFEALEACTNRRTANLGQDGAEVDDSAARRGTSRELVAILKTAFCLARCTERRTFVETTYSPHHWNGKRWVKKGKRVGSSEAMARIAAGWWQGVNAPGVEGAKQPQWWLKPVEKEVERVCEVEVATFEDVRRFAKDSCKDDCRRALQLLGAQNKRADLPSRLTPAQRGELATLLGLHVKVNATAAEGDAQWFLYEHCGLPKQFKKEQGKLTTKLASDDEAIIKAWVAKKDRRAIWFLNLRQLITSTKSLQAEPDADGRIRCGYNLVGAETHRLTCYGSPTGSSDLNLQTVTKDHRVLYAADDDHWMAQRDLSGADGFTVAAYMAMLGDDTMLLDYAAKLKPAQILVLMLDRGTVINKLSRDELKPLCKPITEETDWRYFAMKRVQHGGSYMMWKNTMSDQILTDSFKKTGKPIYVPPGKCEEMLVKCLFVRYPGLPRLHNWMEREIKEKGELRSSDGFVRRFYGRKDDKATVKAALAHLPQYYTTRATMMALLRLWTDAENRREDGSLRIEPLHTVHDSLVTQFRKVDTEWAKVKLDSWFRNEFLIAQTMLTIPASGTYGASWGEQVHSL